MEEKVDIRIDEKVKENKDNHNETPPNTTNSSTMTCLENQFSSWPPPMYLPQYPYSTGVFNSPLPPQQMCYPNPYNYNSIPFQNGPMFSPFCTGMGMTQSTTSVGGTQSTQSNISASVSSSTTNVDNAQTQTYYQMPVPMANHYNPYHMWYSPVPIVLSPGQVIPPGQSNGTNVSHSLCSKCSKDIFVVRDEGVGGNNPVVIGSNVTSFVDSRGRLWRCVNPRPGKQRVPRGRQGVDTSQTNVPRPRTCSASSPQPNEPNILEESDRVPKVRKCKARIRRNHEEISIGLEPTQDCCSKSPQPRPRGSKLRKHIPHFCHRTKRGNTLNDSPLNDNEELSKGNEEDKPREQSSPAQKTPFESDTDLNDNEKPRCHSADRKQSASSFTPDNAHLSQNDSEETAVPTSHTKHAVVDHDRKPFSTASCNDLKRKGTNKKAAALSQYKHESKSNEEELWSSSSSGTYDDSEAFDCYKLLRDIKQQRHNIETAFRQSRQCSRDRLFRKRTKLVGSARSEEGFDGRRRSASPPAKESVNRSQEQIILDTSQLRITEETPKRFIVESKKDSSSPKSMTITVQADMARSAALAGNDICEFCRTERRGDSSCSCHIPPCQRPQWQAPPCPANEIHGTPIHRCHETPLRPPRHAVVSRNEVEGSETSMGERLDEYHRCRRQNLPTFGLVSPWNQRNADRPHEENRHTHFHTTVERFENIRREHTLPTNRRRWHNQEPPAAPSRGSPPAEEMLRIQIPSTFPRYRLYDYPRANEDEGENNEGNETTTNNRNRNTIDINIFRTGVRRQGNNPRRSTRSNSPRSRSHGVEDVAVPEEDPDNSQDFYRRPRSAITVRTSNFFSRRNQKLEEEVQRIESGNGGWNTPSNSSATESKEVAKTCDKEQQFEGTGKPDSEYEEIEVKLEAKRHRDVEDEEDD